MKVSILACTRCYRERRTVVPAIAFSGPRRWPALIRPLDGKFTTNLSSSSSSSFEHPVSRTPQINRTSVAKQRSRALGMDQAPYETSPIKGNKIHAAAWREVGIAVD